MAERPFHHGSLRAVLLERAEAMLRTGGVDTLSLRELARQAGVSHGAPRSHFIDRQALLDALAVRGFERLTGTIRSALDSGGDFEQRLRDVAVAYVSFAVDEAALMELMFAAKIDSPAGPVHEAAVQLFQVLDAAFDEESGSRGPDEGMGRAKLLFAATLQGIASLLIARRVTAHQGDQLTADAVTELLGSSLIGRAADHP